MYLKECVLILKSKYPKLISVDVICKNPKTRDRLCPFLKFRIKLTKEVPDPDVLRIFFYNCLQNPSD